VHRLIEKIMHAPQHWSLLQWTLLYRATCPHHTLYGVGMTTCPHHTLYGVGMWHEVNQIFTIAVNLQISNVKFSLHALHCLRYKCL